MNFNKVKSINNFKIKHFLVVIFLIILVFALINSASAMEKDDAEVYETDLLTVNSLHSASAMEKDDAEVYESSLLTVNSVHNIGSDTTNDDIQRIFDNANSGDTIQFNDKLYENVSIVVNKKLNIVSTKGSTIKTSDSISKKAESMGIDKSFGFYFTKLASGSLLKGITLTGNSDYEIFVEGGSDITIANNTVSGGKSAGIYLNNSKNSIVKNNNIKNSNDGIYINNVNKSLINNNKIFSNKNIGLILRNTASNNVTSNSIYGNDLDGLLLEESQNNNILKNNITNNRVSGVRLEGTTSYNIIKYNNISSNSINIFADSFTKYDEITRNTLMYAKSAFNTYTGYDNTGSAIFFGDNYATVNKGKMLFSYNSIGFNEQWDAKTDMSNLRVEIGANWYFDNDGNYAIGHICPMIFGSALSASNFKYLSMGFSADGDGVFGQLYEGSKARGAGEFTVDNININGVDYGPVKVDSNGRLNLDLKKLKAGSNITVTINGHSFTVTVDEDLESIPKDNANDHYNTSPKSKVNGKNYTKENLKSDVPSRNNPSSKNSGNGTGSGTGSKSGTGSGEGNFTGSGISVGDLSGESNAGTGDSGENGGGSASEGVNAYELLKEENTPTTAKNSQLFAVAGVALVLLIIALGYRSKNKDEYVDNNDNYEL